MIVWRHRLCRRSGPTTPSRSLPDTSRDRTYGPVGSNTWLVCRPNIATYWTVTQGLGKVFHSSCWLGDLSGLGDELEWSQRVSRVVSEGCGDADSSGQAMEADRGVA